MASLLSSHPLDSRSANLCIYSACHYPYVFPKLFTPVLRVLETLRSIRRVGKSWSWQVREEQFTPTRASVRYEKNSSCNLVGSNRLNPILVHAQQPVLPGGGTKVSTSIGFVEEHGVQEKPISRVRAKIDCFLTTRFLDTNPGSGVAVRWSNSVIEDDGTFISIHPEFDYVGVPVAV